MTSWKQRIERLDWIATLLTACLAEWLNECSAEWIYRIDSATESALKSWMHEWLIEHGKYWSNDGLNTCMTELVFECTNEWMWWLKWWLNHCTNGRTVVRFFEWIKEWVKESMIQQFPHWNDGWVNRWVNQLSAAVRTGCDCTRLHTLNKPWNPLESGGFLCLWSLLRNGSILSLKKVSPNDTSETKKVSQRPLPGRTPGCIPGVHSRGVAKQWPVTPGWQSAAWPKKLKRKKELGVDMSRKKNKKNVYNIL